MGRAKANTEVTRRANLQKKKTHQSPFLGLALENTHVWQTCTLQLGWAARGCPWLLPGMLTHFLLPGYFLHHSCPLSFSVHTSK